ncbi:hypothetical protein BJF78_17405 [Pseudonocardia sp. CNS-139]|nr:hypothetical protein BJF78_17405 [Pseudonocardia sp. CNS-139]
MTNPPDRPAVDFALVHELAAGHGDTWVARVVGKVRTEGGGFAAIPLAGHRDSARSHYDAFVAGLAERRGPTPWSWSSPGTSGGGGPASSSRWAW